MPGRNLEPWATPPQFRTTPEGIADRIRARQASTAVPLIPAADPSAGPGAGFLRTIPPPLQVLPPNGVDFNRGGNLAGATSATTPAVVGAASYTVPQGSVGYLKSFDVQVSNLLPTSDIRFSLRIDGGSIPGWDDLFILPGNIAVFVKSWGPDELFLELPPAKTLDIAVTIADGGTYDIGAALHGWTVSQQAAETFAAGWGL